MGILEYILQILNDANFRSCLWGFHLNHGLIVWGS
jgi:hypothetical protein